MKAISIRQPWATLISLGLKTIEVRSQNFSYRGPLLIHSSRTPDREGLSRFPLDELPLGCLVGTVQLVDVKPFTRSSWEDLQDEHLGLGSPDRQLFALHLTEPVPAEQPVPYSGRLGLFDVDEEFVERMTRPATDAPENGVVGEVDEAAERSQRLLPGFE